MLFVQGAGMPCGWGGGVCEVPMSKGRRQGLVAGCQMPRLAHSLPLLCWLRYQGRRHQYQSIQALHAPAAVRSNQSGPQTARVAHVYSHHFRGLAG